MAIEESENGRGLLGMLPRSKINVNLIGKKLVCRVWNDDGVNGTPKRLAKTTVKYGKPEFVVKIGGKKRLYKINYEDDGIIKQDGNVFIYDTHFDNTVGAFRFYEFPEAMDSDQAYTVFRNNAVDMYVKKGGIPFLYLLVAMGAVIVMAIAMIATVPSGMRAQEQVQELDGMVTELKQENASLKAELGNTTTEPPRTIPPPSGNGDNRLGG